jgi:acylglycerol lipase
MAPPTEATFQGVGRLKIFYRSWRPAGKPRAAVVICHGVNSHGGQYFWPAEQLAAANLAVHAVDLRGRGRSEGARFYVENVAEYVSDVAALVKIAKARDPGLPVFLLGHSAGGVVSSSYALDSQAELAGLICESFAFKVPAPDFALAIIKGLSRIAPRLPVLKLKNKDFSRDPKAVQALENDPLIAKEVQPAITVAALVRANERLKREFPRITLPVFIMHGTADKATLPAGSQFFYDTAGSKDKP